LAGAISNLQIAFVEAVRTEESGGISSAVPKESEAAPKVEEHKVEEQKVEERKPADVAAPEQTDLEGKKKFVKSYGS
jgi:hypothetical protein